MDENERTSVRLLRDFLRAHGYREEEIITDYRAGANRGSGTWVDAVVVDHWSGTPLLAFEIKAGKVDHNDPNVRGQLKRISDAFSPDEVLTYLAKVDAQKRSAQIWEYQGADRPLVLVNTNIPRPAHDVPSPDQSHSEAGSRVLDASSAMARARLTTRQRRGESAGTFATACRWLSVGAILLAALDLMFKLGVTSVHVSLLGVASLLLVAPYAAQVSLLGVELKGLSKQDKLTNETHSPSNNQRADA